jgi:RNA-binding protein YlmH
MMKKNHFECFLSISGKGRSQMSFFHEATIKERCKVKIAKES